MVDAPAETVWKLVADVEGWPDLTESITSVELAEPGPLRVGSRAHIRQPKLPPATWTVTELVDGERFTWVSRGPGVLTTAHHVVTARGDGAELLLALEQAGPLGAVFGRLYAGLTRRYLDLEANGTKRRAESLS